MRRWVRGEALRIGWGSTSASGWRASRLFRWLNESELRAGGGCCVLRRMGEVAMKSGPSVKAEFGLGQMKRQVKSGLLLLVERGRIPCPQLQGHGAPGARRASSNWSPMRWLRPMADFLLVY